MIPMCVSLSATELSMEATRKAVYQDTAKYQGLIALSETSMQHAKARNTW